MWIAVMRFAIPDSDSTVIADSASHHRDDGLPPAIEPTGTVVRVIDGDTIVVDVAGKNVTVRLLGIDAPESVKPGFTQGCWGENASQYAQAILPPGLPVTLVSDPGQDKIDRYGRTLAYVKTFDGWDYSIEAALVGMVKSYVYDHRPDVEHQLIADAEQGAKTAGKGLWGPPCYGNTASVPR